MKNILLKSGELVTIGSRDDAMYVISDKLGNELTEYISEMYYTQEEFFELAEENFKNERIIESLEECYNPECTTLYNDEYFKYLIGSNKKEVKHELLGMVNNIVISISDKSRLKKADVLRSLEEIRRIIQKEINE